MKKIWACKLFKRSKHGMELMPNTEEIIEALKIICREENRITQIATNLTSLDSGYIRIGTIQSISYHWLPDILKNFSKAYPNIRFEMTVDGFSALREKIRAGKLDCIFVSRYSVPGLPFVPIGKDELDAGDSQRPPFVRKGGRIIVRH
ncbi:MAG: LysR family transcriptional regulator [[Clostridium] scindens]